MAYRRKCKDCYRWISIRQMPHGKWVAFEGEKPHDCDTPVRRSPSKRPDVDFEWVDVDIDTGSEDEIADLQAGIRVGKPSSQLAPVSAELRALVLNGCTKGSNAQFVYVNSDGIQTNREVTLLSLDGDHVRAYCHLRDEPRTFRLDRISELSVAEAPPERWRSDSSSVAPTDNSSGYVALVILAAAVMWLSGNC